MLLKDPRRLHRNRTVDLLFRSVAAHGGKRIIGVKLSGSLDDGSRGLAAINQAGGLSMVLTPVTLKGLNMPQNAIDYGDPIDLIGARMKLPRPSAPPSNYPARSLETWSLTGSGSNRFNYGRLAHRIFCYAAAAYRQASGRGWTSCAAHNHAPPDATGS